MNFKRDTDLARHSHVYRDDGGILDVWVLGIRYFWFVELD
jgi:hypothetical protein